MANLSQNVARRKYITQMQQKNTAHLYLEGVVFESLGKALNCPCVAVVYITTYFTYVKKLGAFTIICNAFQCDTSGQFE